jgi:lysozyme
MYNGLDLIKQFEGLKLEAYLCPAGVPTIGYGQTGPDVKLGNVITESEAEDMLLKEYKHFEAEVKKLVKITINENQLGALTCFAYNVGLGNLKASSLLRLLNEGRITLATKEFMKWDKAKVKGVLTPLKGLTRRRLAEQALFNTAIV